MNQIQVCLVVIETLGETELVPDVCLNLALPEGNNECMVMCCSEP